MRMFVAVLPPADVVDSISDFLEPRREADPALRWTEPYQWHLTLAFLPSVGTRILDDLIERLRWTAAQAPSFDVTLTGSGAFPTPERTKVLWLGVDPGSSPPLGELATGVRSAANTVGAEVEGGRFRPHLTLARIAQPQDSSRWLRVLDAYEGQPWTAASIALVESHLGQGRRGHPRYESIAVLPLAPFEESE